MEEVRRSVKEAEKEFKEAKATLETLLPKENETETEEATEEEKGEQHYEIIRCETE